MLQKPFMDWSSNISFNTALGLAILYSVPEASIACPRECFPKPQRYVPQPLVPPLVLEIIGTLVAFGLSLFVEELPF